MAEKDMTEKTLESYNDVFADIVNVLLFDGKRYIKEDELVEASHYSMYKTDGKLHEQERDVAKYWQNGKIRIAMLGIENQTAPDDDMPLRVISYDGAAYRAQLLADRKSTEIDRYPVATIILYFGYKSRWNKSLTLLERLKVPDILKPFVNDYRINLFEIAWLTDERVNMFQSDFRLVADYFVQMRKNNDYIPSNKTIRHVHEFLQLMSAMTNDHRYEGAYNKEMAGGKTTMCEVLDKIEKRGYDTGYDAGKVTLLNNLIRINNLTSQKAMDMVGIAPEDRERFIKLLAKFNQ